MKIWSLTLLTLLISLSLKGQIEKEHTFNSDNVSYFKVDEQQGYFAAVNEQKVRLYNRDYSLQKTLTIPPRNNTKVLSIRNLSENLFDQNKNDLEFLVRYQDTVNYDTKYAIVREGGSILKKFTGFTYVSEINGEPKILVRLDNETEVYSLPGELTPNLPVKGNGGNVGNVELYPNPASEQVNLQYDLSGNQTAQIKIYRATGHLQEQLRAGPDFDHIKLDVSGYKPGNYFYRIVVDRQIRDKGKFVVVD